jgi:HTH-type transcriptional regulator, transcriptional repressor of NAD biosynthesis genes
MCKAFVFGKFMPFHSGHEAMIRFALSQCDFLTVLVCCSDRELMPCSQRKRWITDTFADHEKVEVVMFDYEEDELPSTSVSSSEVSKIWAAKFKELFPDYTRVITSEPYGDMVAGFMGIEHIAFDPQKQLHPVSATKIRADAFSNWAFLPESVKEDYITKVVILGTESTGKTTLTERLSNHFNSAFVLEAGREVISDSTSFSMDDLTRVAEVHAERIADASVGKSPLLIIDTDIHITLSYGQFTFEMLPEVDERIYQRNKADLYLYLNNDVAYIQDGTRLSEEDRNLLDHSHRQVLEQFNIQYEEIAGDWEERFKKSVALIEKLISR